MTHQMIYDQMIAVRLECLRMAQAEGLLGDALTDRARQLIDFVSNPPLPRLSGQEIIDRADKRWRQNAKPMG